MASLILGADGKPLPQYKKQGEDVMEAWEGRNGAGLFAADDGAVETLGSKSDAPTFNITADGFWKGEIFGYDVSIVALLKAMTAHMIGSKQYQEWEAPLVEKYVSIGSNANYNLEEDSNQLQVKGMGVRVVLEINTMPAEGSLKLIIQDRMYNDNLKTVLESDTITSTGATYLDIAPGASDIPNASKNSFIGNRMNIIVETGTQTTGYDYGLQVHRIPIYPTRLFKDV